MNPTDLPPRPPPDGLGTGPASLRAALSTTFVRIPLDGLPVLDPGYGHTIRAVEAVMHFYTEHDGRWCVSSVSLYGAWNSSQHDGVRRRDSVYLTDPLAARTTHPWLRRLLTTYQQALTRSTPKKGRP